MQVSDFMQCTFQGDSKIYIAEVLLVTNENFNVRFVHTESRYTFSKETFTVIKSTGMFRPGTQLTSHQFFTFQSTDINVNDFVVVTFANNKNYIGTLKSTNPEVVQFLHEKKPTYIFQNNTIIQSEGFYTVGQRIIGITSFTNSENDQPIPKVLTEIDLTQNEISLEGEEFKNIANNLQGNILKPHGRPFSNHLFFKFTPNKIAEAKEFLQNFANEKLTSAAEQKLDAEIFSTENRLAVEAGRAPNLEQLQQFFYTLYLSKNGYNYLELNSDSLEITFGAGMKNASVRLEENSITTWDQGFQDEIHGMILIAWGGTDRQKLDDETKLIVEKLTHNNLAIPLSIEKGTTLKNSDGKHIEHFGYVDGISQPLFFKEEIDEQITNGNISNQGFPGASLNLVLVKDPLAMAPNSFGSYFVFRKLEQNVKAFKEAEQKLDKELFGANGSGNNLAGAMMVGRFQNGMPVTLSDKSNSRNGTIIGNDKASKINDFNYAADLDGSKCPFHAHIRKTNPRDESNDINERTHKIVRRGIPYNDSGISINPTNNAGLLFMCYQANIGMQFEFIQEFWANSPDFIKPKTGIDSIIGNHGLATPDVNKTQNYPKIYGDANSIVTVPEIKGFVTLKGGEYFFAPSISFFKELIPVS